MNELITYRLYFDGYTYDQLISKLVEVPVIAFQKFSLVQATIVATSSRSELMVTTTKELEPIRGGAKVAIVVVVNTRVEGLKELVTPNPIPLVILKIGVGVEVILIDTITHASEVFKTLYIVLKDTLVVERLGFQLVPLVEPIDTIGEQHVNDLTTRIKQVILGD